MESRISGGRNNSMGYGPHSINLLSEDFISGFQHSNRMSVVRRFFCLFVTFDLIFITLLWIICVVINGEDIYNALEKQVIHYNIENSLFDIVVLAACRFIMLILFYAICHLNHWIIVAISTTLSCAFIIYKVFVYAWPSSQQPVFQVLLIIISFILGWFEAWYWDGRVVPQEMYSRALSQAFISSNDPRTPLLDSFLNAQRGNLIGPESYNNFYSPVDSVDGNSDENEEEDFKRLGAETVVRAFALLESSEWKMEKVTASNDTIQTCSKSIGKVYKLTGKVNYPPGKLLMEFFHNIDDIPKWNPTLLESRVIKKIDSSCDISYNVSASGGGGMVKSRDFVNLRSWRLMNDSKFIENYDINSLSNENENCQTSIPRRENGNRSQQNANENVLKRTSSDIRICETNRDEPMAHISKSLDVSSFNNASEEDERYSDAQTELKNELDESKNVFISAALSIDYPLCPPTTKYIRGENTISCWVMRAIEGDSESCIFQWLMCIDLKGSLPKYVLNAAFVSLMQDYMKHLRSHIKQLNEQSRKHASEEC